MLYSILNRLLGRWTPQAVPALVPTAEEERRRRLAARYREQGGR